MAIKRKPLSEEEALELKRLGLRPERYSMVRKVTANTWILWDVTEGRHRVVELAGAGRKRDRR